MLCDQVEQGVVGVLRMLSFNPGRDYEVVFVSFDPRETPEMAAEKKKTMAMVMAAAKNTQIPVMKSISASTCGAKLDACSG